MKRETSVLRRLFGRLLGSGSHGDKALAKGAGEIPRDPDAADDLILDATAAAQFATGDLADNRKHDRDRIAVAVDTSNVVRVPLDLVPRVCDIGCVSALHHGEVPFRLVGFGRLIEPENIPLSHEPRALAS
jgi:hypothetical protein